MQTVEDLEDALPERSTSYDRVVDNHEVILIGLQRAVGDVIDVGSKVVALRSFCDEGAQFDVLPHHLLDAHLMVHTTHAIRHAIEGHLCRVRDIGEDGMSHIAIDGPHDGWQELLTQLLALVVDVAIGASAKVDTLERTGARICSR